MSRITHLKPEFVEYMPAILETGTIYVSIRFLMTAHLCACGCEEKVVLPLHPSQWQIAYDGVDVSLCPSVGNAGLACRSHYWIKAGRVEWSVKISEGQARRGNVRDRRALAQYDSSYAQADTPSTSAPRPSLLDRFRRLLRSK